MLAAIQIVGFVFLLGHHAEGARPALNSRPSSLNSCAAPLREFSRTLQRVLSFDDLPIDEKIQLLEEIKSEERSALSDQLLVLLHYLENGRSMSVERNAESITVNSQSAQSVLGGQSTHSMFAYSGIDGRDRVVKVLQFNTVSVSAWQSDVAEIRNLPSDEEFVAPNAKRIRSVQVLSKFTDSLLAAYFGEKLGGAKVLGFGMADVPSHTTTSGIEQRLYIEMEGLPAGPDSIFLKHASQSNLPVLYSVEGNHARVTRQMVNLLFESVKQGIITADPDFHIDPAGNVRWIDYGLWHRAKSRDEIVKKFPDTIWQIAKRLFHRGDSPPDPQMRVVASNFFREFLRQLKKSSEFVPNEKLSILEAIFDWPGSGDDSWGNQVATELGLKAPETDETMRNWILRSYNESVN